MKILIVGCGSIGKRHLSNLKLLSAGELIAYDVKRECIQEIEGKYKVKVFSDFEEAMNQKPQVVLICTPTSMHLPYALAAAKRNCHLFIEKPLSHTMEGVDELIDIVSVKNLVLLVGCNFRFHWGLIVAKRLLDKGKIGRVVSAHAQFGQYLPDWHPWEDYRQGYSAQQSLGGGIILDGVHELDYLHGLLGEFREVYCCADKLSNLEIDVEDTADFVLRLDSKAIVSVHLDYVQRPYNRCLEIVGEEGTIIWSYQDNLVKFYSAGKKGWQIIKKGTYEVNEMYIDEMKHFLRCIEGKERPLVDGRAGRRILETALAAKKSSQSKSAIHI